MHHVGKLSSTETGNGVYDGHSEGLARRVLVGEAEGSPHQAVTVAELAPGGRVERHVHAFEEAFYVLRGTVELDVANGLEQLSVDDYCFVEQGVPHALRNAGAETARLFELSAPQPGTAMIEDTVFLSADAAIDLPEPAFRRGHFDESQLPAPSENLGLAGFRAANVGGAAVKIIIDRDFGASQFILMVLQYAPGGFISEHDHAFEEAFFFLDGEIEAVLDGQTHNLGAGDYFWSGVGSRHALTNRSDAPVRWLETQVPQPPSRHQARFRADWERLIAP
jgi:quercetin dioxygenase-like cupin family protein